jgi:hypothetical protein
MELPFFLNAGVLQEGGELISVPYMAPLGVFRLYTLSMLLHKRFSGWAIFSDFLKKVMG